MSDLTGHYFLTTTAVSELQRDYADDLLINDIAPQHPSRTPTWGEWSLRLDYGLATLFYNFVNKNLLDPIDGVIVRDINDAYSGDHWAYTSTDAQNRHFMCATGQAARNAYDRATAWIEFSARNAGVGIAERMQEVNFKSRYMKGQSVVVGGTPAAMLGNAVHALQDSFSPGHVTRATGGTGAIEVVKIYEYQQGSGVYGVNDHETGDRAWSHEDGTLSTIGRHAVDATKALLRLVFSAALKNTAPAVLTGWSDFQKTWLLAGKLSTGVKVTTWCNPKAGRKQCLTTVTPLESP